MTESNMFDIQPATTSDIPLIVEFIKELAEFEKLLHTVETTPELIKEHIFGESPKAHVIIAREASTQKPAGMALYFYNFSTFTGRPGVYLEDLFVRESFRKMGLGKQFFNKLAQIAVELNYGRLEWTVLDWNKQARDFYKKMGCDEMADWIICRISRDGLMKLAMK